MYYSYYALKAVEAHAWKKEAKAAAEDFDRCAPNQINGIWEAVEDFSRRAREFEIVLKAGIREGAY